MTKKTVVEPSIFKVEHGKDSYYVVDVSIRDSEGRRRFRRTKAPNLTVARKMKHELKQQLITEASAKPDLTLERFFHEHYVTRLEERYRPSTFIRAVSTIRATILPTLGHRRLRSIAPADVDDLLVRHLKHLSGQTRRHVLAHLRDICRVATLTGYLVVNPTLNVTRPKLNKKDPLVLKEQEVRRLLAFLQKHQPVMFYHAFLAVSTLARAGELRALTWADVDLEGKMLSINKTCDPKTGLKDCPKNGENRLIPINSELETVLREMRQSTYTADSDLVLPHWREFAAGEQGKPLKLILEALGMPPIRWHDFRATGITLLLSRGIPHSKVMKISGHKDLSSFNIYLRLAGVEIDGALDTIRLCTHDTSPPPKPGYCG